jgi:hypothetical protein
LRFCACGCSRAEIPDTFLALIIRIQASDHWTTHEHLRKDTRRAGKI